MNLVSIITPVYNTEKFLAGCITSVLQQTHTNWELLIIDDGSVDGSANVVKQFNDPRIHYFHQENQGVSAARNAALRRMKGDFFCFLDGDDVMPPHSIA